MRYPARYINQPVTIAAGYCFSDPPNYACVGKDTPFEVVSRKIAANATKAAIEENCGGLEGAERNPSAQCAYAFRFVATGYRPIVSDYVLHDRLQSQKRVIHFDADLLEPVR